MSTVVSAPKVRVLTLDRDGRTAQTGQYVPRATAITTALASRLLLLFLTLSLPLAAFASDLQATSSGKILFVVSKDVVADMRPLLQNFMDAVQTDTGYASVLLESPAQPAAIRAYFQSVRSEIKFAFLIGNVPIVRRLTDDDGTDKYETSDHYYRALDFPYPEPARTSDGTFHLPGRALDYWITARTIEFCPTIGVSRIRGDTSASELADIRTFLEKNLRLRNALAAYPQQTVLVAPFRAFMAMSPPFNVPAVLEAHENHPLSGSGLFTFIFGKPAAEAKTEFVNALHSAGYVKLMAHGSQTSLLFEGPAASDNLFVSDTAALLDGKVRARLIDFINCHAGDFATRGNTAVRATLAGDTMYAIAAPYIKGTVWPFDLHDALGFEFALGVGRRHAFIYPYTTYQEVVHLFGDPTVALRVPDLTIPQPRLVLGDRESEQEFSYSMTLRDVHPDGISGTVTLTNSGDADLIINGWSTPMYESTAPVDRGSGGRWFVSLDGDSFAKAVDGYAVPKGVRIAPHSTKTLYIRLNKSLYGKSISGTHRAFFHFTCNDPRIGAFRVDVSVSVTTPPSRRRAVRK